MQPIQKVCAALAVLVCAAWAGAVEPKLNLDTWKHMPLLHHGRVMPLDTFARSAAEIICDRVRPTLTIDGQIRRFDASELLLSWMVEPQKWEDVPFLIAEHDELRKLLNVPVTGEDGTHLRYVSPATVADSDAVRQYLEDLREKQREAAQENKSFELSALDNRVRELYDAFTLYRQITFDPRTEAMGRPRFLQVASNLLEGWSKLEQDLAIWREKPETNELIQSIDTAMMQVAQSGSTGRFQPAQVEPSVVILTKSLQQLADETAQFKQRIFSAKAGDIPGFDKTQLETARARLNRLAASVKLLSRQALELHSTIYDNGDALRIVPSLDVVALNKNRDVTDEAPPWLTLQTVLYGSKEFLASYPQPQISAVRATYGRLAAAYIDRNKADGAQAFDKAQNEFASAVRKLGDQITIQRDKLEFAGRDEDLLKYTAYPPADATKTEVAYNQLDPFKWSWVISLAGFICFCLAFGVARKPMFWLGMAILTFGLAWSVYGFAMRVAITKWAPVTNMYETVIYVPFFVSLLGAWFALLPITWPGLKKAWQMTGIPGTWEAVVGDDGAPAPQWGLSSILFSATRLALMALTLRVLAFEPYAAGGRTIVSLLPVVDEGSSLPNMNSLVVWLVGMAVLVPTVWYLPRVILAMVIGCYTVTASLLSRGSELVNQVYIRKPFGLAATFAAFLGSFIAWYSPVLDKNFSPLQPVLRDNFWLTIHVLTIVSSYGAGMLAWGLGNLSLGYYLFGKYRDPQPAKPSKLTAAGLRPAVVEGDDAAAQPAMQPGRLPPEACHTLAGFIYKTFQVAVLLLAAGTILGGLWADVSWGRFWGWDPKEVWALVSLLAYLAILHGRFAGLFGDFGLAAGSVLGASAIVFSWYGVNFVLGAGLHSYGFGSGGQREVFSVVALNWLFLGIAGFRYRLETQGKPLPQPSAAVAVNEPKDEEVSVG